MNGDLGIVGRMTDAHMLRIVFGSVLVVVGGLWLISLPVGPLAGDFWSLRGALIYGAGVLAFSSMSLAVILASRPVLIEGLLGGLDTRRVGPSLQGLGRERALAGGGDGR